MPVAGAVRPDAGAVAAELVSRLPGTGDAQRVGAGLGALHAAIAQLKPTPAEWRSVIEFLTDIGQASDDRRQEMVLLSDVLGVTSAIGMLHNQRPRGATPNAPRGPFYRPDAPALPLGACISLDGVGEPLHVRGSVRDLDGASIVGATVETWQASSEGFYENQRPDAQPEFNLRGVFTTDGTGAFAYTSVKPAGYDIPSDGPVGRLMHLLGVPRRRPAHLHFQVSAPGFETLTTQIFDRIDAGRHPDPVFGVRPELLVDVARRNGEGGKPEWTVGVPLVLVRARPESRPR